jgi:hypothetical protein
MDEERIHHEVVRGVERVDDPLIVQQCKVALARCVALDGVFVGVAFEGFQGLGGEREEVAGELVLTVELAEAVAELLVKAVAKARAAGADHDTQQ